MFGYSLLCQDRSPTRTSKQAIFIEGQDIKWLQTLKELEVILQGFYCFSKAVFTYSMVWRFEKLSVKSNSVLECVDNVCGQVVGMKL